VFAKAEIDLATAAAFGASRLYSTYQPFCRFTQSRQVFRAQVAEVDFEGRVDSHRMSRFSVLVTPYQIRGEWLPGPKTTRSGRFPPWVTWSGAPGTTTREQQLANLPSRFQIAGSW
jgi:hypothetical protein